MEMTIQIFYVVGDKKLGIKFHWPYVMINVHVTPYPALALDVSLELLVYFAVSVSDSN